jgi:hypothetical protein
VSFGAWASADSSVTAVTVAGTGNDSLAGGPDAGFLAMSPAPSGLSVLLSSPPYPASPPYRQRGSSAHTSTTASAPTATGPSVASSTVECRDDDAATLRKLQLLCHFLLHGVVAGMQEASEGDVGTGGGGGGAGASSVGRDKGFSWSTVRACVEALAVAAACAPCLLCTLHLACALLWCGASDVCWPLGPTASSAIASIVEDRLAPSAGVPTTADAIAAAAGRASTSSAQPPVLGASLAVGSGPVASPGTGVGAGAGAMVALTSSTPPRRSLLGQSLDDVLASSRMHSTASGGEDMRRCVARIGCGTRGPLWMGLVPSSRLHTHVASSPYLPTSHLSAHPCSLSPSRTPLSLVSLHRMLSPAPLAPLSTLGSFLDSDSVFLGSSLRRSDGLLTSLGSFSGAPEASGTRDRDFSRVWGGGQEGRKEAVVSVTSMLAQANLVGVAVEIMVLAARAVRRVVKPGTQVRVRWWA